MSKREKGTGEGDSYLLYSPPWPRAPGSGGHFLSASLQAESDLPLRLKKQAGGGAPWAPTRGKDSKIQGITVRATRNPILRYRYPVEYPLRNAERRYLRLLFQEPPRKTRRAQSPLCHAIPSAGAPR